MAGFIQIVASESLVPIDTLSSRQTIDAGALALTASPGLRPPSPLSSTIARSTATSSLETGQPQLRMMLNGHSALVLVGMENLGKSEQN